MFQKSQKDSQTLLENFETAIQPVTTYVVVPFSLTHKAHFSIVLPEKAIFYHPNIDI